MNTPSRFKVGDRVKVVFNHPAKGQVATITSIDEDGCKFVKYDNPKFASENGKWAEDSSLELLLQERTDNFSYEERVAYWLKKLD